MPVFHDGELTSVEVGPRREVRLHVGLDPVWSDGDASVVVAHVSKIENFDEVREWFARVAAAGGRDRVVALRDVGRDLLVELDHHGAVTLRGGRLRE